MNTLLRHTAANLRKTADKLRLRVVDNVAAAGHFSDVDFFLLEMARWLDIFARFGEKAAR